MKKSAFLFLFAIFFSPFAIGQSLPTGGEWTIMETFDIPGKASGLAWDGTYLYFGIYGQYGDQFYQFDPASGEATLLFTHPEIEDSFGMSCDGENLWVIHQPSGSSNPSLATQLDLGGNILSTITLPDHYMSGIAWDEGKLWVSTYYPDPGTVYQIDDQGTVLQQFAPPIADQVWDLCRQDDFLWFADYNADLIYKTDLSGAILEQHDAENIKPSGIVYDGTFLWYVDGQLSSPSTLYKIDLGGAGTPEINVPVTYHDFGMVTVGDSAVWNLSVFNQGNAPLSLDNFIIPNLTPVFTYEVFPQIVEPGESTELVLIFKPIEASLLAVLINLQSNDPVTPEVEIQLEGESVLEGPVIQVVDDNYDYGQVRARAFTRWFVELANIGDEALIIESIESSDPAFVVDETIVFPFSISPLQIADFGIWFNPGEGLVYEGMLAIFSNDPQNPEVEVLISGQGVEQDYPMGEQLWQYTISGGFDNSPKAIGSLKDITGDAVNEVIVASEDNLVRCFNGNSDGSADVLWAHEIYSGNVYQSEALGFLPDIDGDGYDEVVVGTTGGDRAVKVLSGKTGEQVWVFHTNTWGDGGWVYEVDASRDYTGDDVADVLACAGGSSTGTGASRVFCLDGSNGDLVWDYYLNGPGFSVIAIDDVNGDGISDVLAGAANADESQGKTVCVDGSTGFEIWTDLAEGSSVWALAQLDDINSDGVNDVASGEFGSGDFKIFDATNGDVLQSGSMGGGYVIITDIVPLNDVNDDGYADFTIQASTSNLVVVDGLTGETLWLTSLADQVQKVNRIPDVSGDGINDIAVGTLYQNNYVYFIDGVNGDILDEIEYGQPVDALLVIPDINGDDSWEVVAGGREGKVVCFSGGLDANTFTSEYASPVVKLTILVSPNPIANHGLISLEATDAVEGNLSLITAGGRMIKDFGFQKLENETKLFPLNIQTKNGERLLPGLYFVVFSHGQYTTSTKVIVR